MENDTHIARERHDNALVFGIGCGTVGLCAIVENATIRVWHALVGIRVGYVPMATTSNDQFKCHNQRETSARVSASETLATISCDHWIFGCRLLRSWSLFDDDP